MQEVVNAHNEAQGIEFFRADLLTQDTTLKGLANNMDRRLWAFKVRLDEITDWLDALAISANRDRNDDRQRPRYDFAQCQPINKPIHACHCRQPVYSDNSEEEEDFLFGDHRPIKVVVDILVVMKGRW